MVHSDWSGKVSPPIPDPAGEPGSVKYTAKAHRGVLDLLHRDASGEPEKH